MAKTEFKRKHTTRIFCPICGQLLCQSVYNSFNVLIEQTTTDVFVNMNKPCSECSERQLEEKKAKRAAIKLKPKRTYTKRRKVEYPESYKNATDAEILAERSGKKFKAKYGLSPWDINQTIKIGGT